MELLAEAAQNQIKLPEIGISEEIELDDRSSSLSDLDDRPVTEATNDQDNNSPPAFEGEDSEAETERIEDSPRKIRSQRNRQDIPHIIAGNDLHGLEDAGNGVDDGHDDALNQTSEISSLGDSAEHGMSGIASPSSPVKKRKRSREGSPADDIDPTERSLKKAAVKLANHVAGRRGTKGDPDAHTRASKVTDQEQEPAEGEDSVDSVEGSGGDDGIEDDLEVTRKNETAEAADSSPEDADIEDVGPGNDVDTSSRTEEELAKKRAALDMLSGIEKDFAMLRDKLFEEKTRQLNDELATLESPEVTHAEYLAVLYAIDRRRADNIKQAKTVLQYKMRSLQTKCVAERAQVHSQYMQTVRELRDSALEEAGKEWYQIRRERSLSEEDESNKLYHFSGNPSALLAQQTAYNTEVSILSGIQKYVGFPAAPEIVGASSTEIEEDLEKMGIVRQALLLPIAASIPHVPRQRAVAEEQFLESTPWANAQHPYHTQILNAVQQHNAPGSRPLSPFATPATQKQLGEANRVLGSASTIAASSLMPTPLSVEGPYPRTQRQFSGAHVDHLGETPSRVPGMERQDTLASTISNAPEPGLPAHNANQMSFAVRSGKLQHNSDTTMAGGLSSPPPQSSPNAEDPMRPPLEDSIYSRIGHGSIIAAGVGVGNG